MAQTRTTYTATYLFPGAFFPEETSRRIVEPTFDAACKAIRGTIDGLFRHDRWYAVRITKLVERLATFDFDETDTAWVKQPLENIGSWIIGDAVHYSDIDPEGNEILISNIRMNTKAGYGVRTRVGNWQFADDWDHIVTPAELVA